MQIQNLPANSINGQGNENCKPQGSGDLLQKQSRPKPAGERDSGKSGWGHEHVRREPRAFD